MKITIPKPCHEDWSKMTPNEKGRHCNSCQKSVYNFTNKTDVFIIKTFEKHGNLCGRFKKSQLNRNLYSRKTELKYISYLATGLFAFLALGTHSAIAQGGGSVKIDKTELFQKNTVNYKKGQSILKTRTISGITIDDDGLPLPGVKIVVKGTNNSTTADFDGKFKLKASINDTLSITYHGAKSKEIQIVDTSYYQIHMALDKTNCDNYITAGVVEYETPCQKAKRLKARKEKRQKIRNGKIERTSFGKFLFKLTHVF